jgi:hypothetical protein
MDILAGPVADQRSQWGLCFYEGAGVGPVLGGRTEFGFDGVVADISDGIVVMVQIADIAIVVFAFPDGTGGLVREIDLTGGEGFPTFDYARERFVFGLDEGVDMIGHDNPFKEAVALAIEVEKSALHDFSVSWIREETSSVSRVFVVGDFARELNASFGFI